MPCVTPFDLAGRQAEKAQLEQRMGRPDFWDDPEGAQRTIQQLKAITDVLRPLELLEQAQDDLETLAELAEEGSEQAGQELRAELARVRQLVHEVELRSLLSGPYDAANCFITIHAGAGGTDACDWAQMLLRMYQRWLERHAYSSQIVDLVPGEEAGLRSVTIQARGEYAFGYLQGESGVHRLVRISPFDAAARRHTSFASVDVVPELDDEINIEIRDEDLIVETMRASGAGGQHVNKTSSAVRITHKPTGIVVKCQNERSQLRNRKIALKMLQAKLLRLEEQKRQAELGRLYDEKGQIAFGNQIRSYVLQPYQMVKDHRTGVETSKVQEVLDGELDRFIEAYLRHKAAGTERSREERIRSN